MRFSFKATKHFAPDGASEFAEAKNYKHPAPAELTVVTRYHPRLTSRKNYLKFFSAHHHTPSNTSKNTSNP